MTDIEQKALALVNDARINPSYPYSRLSEVSSKLAINALCHAIERHEAFRQEVSDAVEGLLSGAVFRKAVHDRLDRFIIPKPDPLVEAMQEWWDADGYANIETFRAAIEKRGGRIVWGEG